MSGSREHLAGWGPLFWGVFERPRNAIALVDHKSVYVAANAAMCELLDVPHQIRRLHRDLENAELIRLGQFRVGQHLPKLVTSLAVTRRSAVGMSMATRIGEATTYP